MDIPELQRNAAAGSIVSQSVLGLSYLYGRDVQIDYHKAHELLSLAAQRGASRAVVNLGVMYEQGWGVPKNVQEAIRLYRSVSASEIRASLHLARIHAKGIGVPSDTAEAAKYYSAVASSEMTHDDAAGAAFTGTVTLQEVEEAKAYLARDSSP